MGVINSGGGSTSNVGVPVDTATFASTTSGTALAANINRKRALIYNPATATTTVFIKFGTPATVASSYPLNPGQAWLEGAEGIYTGIITCITSSGTSILQITEWS